MLSQTSTNSRLKLSRLSSQVKKYSCLISTHPEIMEELRSISGGLASFYSAVDESIRSDRDVIAWFLNKK
jgi:hypothetical protein